MNKPLRKILSKSARIYNLASAPFLKYPEKENNFIPEDKKSVRNYNRHRPYGPASKLCYAPFSNIFFNTEGRAIVCCKNTKVVLGKYPDDNLHSMWFGSNVTKLREYILHYDLSFGCYKCREALHSGNYGSMTASGFDFLRVWPTTEYPRLMEFELSNVCNLECVMCSGRVSSGIRKHREGLEPLKMFYNKGFVAQLDEFIPHLKQARFYGGEPFLIEIYYEIWEAILRKNPSVDLYVLTNGTILNDHVKRLLDQGNFTINVSMDSFQKETYEKIRVNAVLEKTLENLHYFRAMMKKKKKRLTLFITPTRLNWSEIPEMVEQCSNWNIDVYFSPAYFPEELALWNLPPEQIEEIIECYRKSNISGTINKVRFKNLIEELSYWSSGQRNDDSFLEKFREDSMQQEQIHELVKPNISIAKGHEYKSLFIDRLRKSGLITIQQENSWLERIEKAIVTGKIESVFVYFFLQGLKPEIFAEQMQKMSDDEIVSFLIKKQEELKNTHILI